MQTKDIFNTDKERMRLETQRKLLSRYELSAILELTKQKENIHVLDIGCNDGAKTVSLFNIPHVSKVIGIDCDPAMIKKAKKNYGSDKFRFETVDIESDDMPDKLLNIKKDDCADGFDIICLSFVLMHLSNAEKLLRSLHPFLRKQGRLFIVEPVDSTSTINPKTELLDEFMRMLNRDKYAGNRQLGAQLPDLLTNCGYDNIQTWCDGIAASADSLALKKAIFETFFSYFPSDVELLCAEEPNNEEYIRWQAWLNENYAQLQEHILCRGSDIFIGTKIISCGSR